MNYFYKNLDFLYKRKTKAAKYHIDEIEKISKEFNIPIEKLFYTDLEKKQKALSKRKIKFFVTDVDGVMTDGGMYFTEKGDEFKKFNVKDGLGLVRLLKSNINVGIISSGQNKQIIATRAKLLGIEHFYVGTGEKILILEEWCKKLKISLNEVAYMGDDLNDIPVINKVGLSVCPADAVNDVKNKVDIILKTNGGFGCIREFIDGYLL